MKFLWTQKLSFLFLYFLVETPHDSSTDRSRQNLCFLFLFVVVLLFFFLEFCVYVVKFLQPSLHYMNIKTISIFLLPLATKETRQESFVLMKSSASISLWILCMQIEITVTDWWHDDYYCLKFLRDFCRLWEGDTKPVLLSYAVSSTLLLSECISRTVQGRTLAVDWGPRRTHAHFFYSWWSRWGQCLQKLGVVLCLGGAGEGWGRWDDKWLIACDH